MSSSPLISTGIFFLDLVHDYDPISRNPVEEKRTRAELFLFDGVRLKMRDGKNYFYRELFIPDEVESSIETSEKLVVYFFFLSPNDCDIKEHFADVNNIYKDLKKIVIANKVFIRFKIPLGTLDVSVWQRTT